MYSEKRKLEPFNRISLKGIGNVYLSVGEEQDVKIESNQDVISRIRTEVFNQELIISVHDTIPLWLVTMPRLDIHVKMKSFAGCRVTGLGRIMSLKALPCEQAEIINTGVGGISLQLKAKHVRTLLSGVGEIELSGETEKLEMELTGTGKIDAYKLRARSASVSSRGIGECILHAIEKLEIRSRGIGTIKYKGNPEIKSEQHGLGGIKNRECSFKCVIF